MNAPRSRRLSRASTARRAVRLVASACALGGALSCSFLVDKNAMQCATDADCAQFGGTVCVAEACVYPGGTSLPPECSTHADCKELRGEGFICRQPDRQCVALRSAECDLVDGDYEAEGAIFIGSLLPTAGANQSFGKPAQNSIRMALSDFLASSNGLPAAPGSPQRRHLVLVGCNDADNPTEAARHLAYDLRVPAIIGAAFSGVTIKVATGVTIPAGVLLISPSATSVAITDLQDNGLVWRTSPTDTLQADALAELVPVVESQIRSSLGLSQQQAIKLAIVHKGDAYGKGLTDTLEQKLVFNGKPALDNASSYMRRDYGDPDVAGSTHYDTVIADVLALKPHVVLVFGTNEAIIDVFAPIEQQWAASSPQVGYAPRYLFSDGGLLQELSDLVGTDNELRVRILGTVPGTDNSLFKAFRSQYEGVFSDGTTPDAFGTAGAYDAAYLLSYAIVAAGTKPITGPTLAEGFAKLIPQGTAIDVGATQINKAIETLSRGESIDFDGASGPLDFDTATGEASSDIQVWCLPIEGTKAGAGRNSGLFYNAATGQLEGGIASDCQ